ncbi:hypothetical protein NKR23_g10411 [Pleurostoma richardsiae]|uniref:Uncharacterized protein n=1 Tax=Pleurostoma richardsiae TaxID=41990 RepID=A0AA38REP7_9PEZI|nr:hypothetical protein NKR23_g10411 [Pleurostoma richardsiae]
MSDIMQAYVSSMWLYSPAGAEKVIKALKDCNFESSEFTYEEKNNWFNVVCRKEDIKAVLEQFSVVGAALETGLRFQELVTEDGSIRSDVNIEWLEKPQSDLWFGHEDCGPEQAIHMSLPPDFHRFKAKTVWARMDQSKKVDRLLNSSARNSLQKVCNVVMSWDLTKGIVYIGGDSEQAVEMAKRKLDTLFESSHILYPEGVKDYKVDARYVDLINRSIVTSTMLDPATSDLGAKYEKMRHGSVSLRICQRMDDGRGFTSLFGPNVPGVFPENGKQQPFGPFFKYIYTPKASTPPRRRLSPKTPKSILDLDDGPMVAGLAKKNQVENWIDRVEDIMPIQSSSSPISYHGIAPSTTVRSSCTSPGPFQSLHLDERAMLEAQKAEIERKLAMLDVKETVTPSQNPYALLSALDESRSSIGILSSAVQGIEREPEVGAEAANNTPSPSARASSGPPPLIDLFDATSTSNPSSKHETNLDMRVLVPGVQIDDEASFRIFHHTMRQQASSRISGQGSSSDFSASDFNTDIINALKKLISCARAKVGSLGLRLEFGRIFLTDIPSSGLAHNGPGEISNGWVPEKLVDMLNHEVGGSKNVLFTNILSVYAGDAEFLSSIKEEHTRRPMWQNYSRKVVYEFRCRSTLHDGKVEDFIVDIDGSPGAGFSYLIRKEASEQVEPIWVHCLHRHWDFRIVLSHTDTDEHREMHGRFAEFLAGSLSIPVNTRDHPKLSWLEDVHDSATVVEVRVHHTSRYLGNNSQSYLDITQVRELAVQTTEQDSETLTRVADVSSPKDAKNGVLACWFEASITSAKGEELLRQNASLTIGDLVAWTSEAFQAAKVFESLYEPATKMITRMDGVGVYCNNGSDEKMLERLIDLTGKDGDGSPTGNQVSSNGQYRRKEHRNRLPGATYW